MYGLSGWPGSGLEGGARAAEGVVTQLEHLERLGLTELGRYKALLVRIRASARARARVRVRVGVRARVGVRVSVRGRGRVRVRVRVRVSVGVRVRVRVRGSLETQVPSTRRSTIGTCPM